MKVSFVIPVYNNADTVNELALQLQQVSNTNKWQFEIIFVNDNSVDHSLIVLKKMLVDYRNKCTEENVVISKSSVQDIQVYHASHNCGQSTSVLTGLTFSSGDFCVVLDADLQDRPDFIPVLLAGFTDEIDVVFSGRHGNYEDNAKLISAKGFKYLLHLLSKKRLPVDACMFFAIKKKAIPPLLAYIGAKPYLLAVIAKEKLCCISIPYQRLANKNSKSNYTFTKRWKLGFKGVSNFFFLTKKRSDLNYIEKIEA